MRKKDNAKIVGYCSCNSRNMSCKRCEEELLNTPIPELLKQGVKILKLEIKDPFK